MVVGAGMFIAAGSSTASPPEDALPDGGAPDITLPDAALGDGGPADAAPTKLCGPGTAQCGDRCVDVSLDPKNCGLCGKACATGEVCSSGACGLSCTGGTTKCGDRCVDTKSDALNCGGCGTDAGANRCGSGTVCSDGNCALTCADNLVACNGGCVDPLTSRQFCGATDGCGEGAGSAGTSCTAGRRTKRHLLRRVFGHAARRRGPGQCGRIHAANLFARLLLGRASALHLQRAEDQQQRRRRHRLRRRALQSDGVRERRGRRGDRRQLLPEAACALSERRDLDVGLPDDGQRWLRPAVPLHALTARSFDQRSLRSPARSPLACAAEQSAAVRERAHAGRIQLQAEAGRASASSNIPPPPKRGIARTEMPPSTATGAPFRRRSSS